LKAFRIYKRAAVGQTRRAILKGGLVGTILGTLSVADDWVPWEQGKPFLVSWEGETPDAASMSEMERRLQTKMAKITQEFGEKGIADWFESLNRSEDLDNLYHPLRPLVIS